MRIAPRGALNYNLNELMRMIGRFERPDFRLRNIPEQNPLYDIPPPEYEGIPNMGMDRDPFTLMQELESGDYPRPTAEDYYANAAEVSRRRIAEIEGQLAALAGEKAAAGLPAVAPSAATPQDIATAGVPAGAAQRDLGGVMPGFSVSPEQIARIRGEAPAVLANLMQNKASGAVPSGPIGGGAYPELMPQSTGNVYRDEMVRRLASIPTREEYDFSNARPAASPSGAYLGNRPPQTATPMTGSMGIYDIPESDMQQLGQLAALAAAEEKIQDAGRQFELDRAVKLAPHFVTVADQQGQRVVGLDPQTGREVTRTEIGGPQPQRGVINELWDVAMNSVGGGKPWNQFTEQEKQFASQEFQNLLQMYRGQAGGLGQTQLPPDPAAVGRGGAKIS